MKNKTDDIFLSLIKGVSPLKKNHKLKKEIPEFKKNLVKKTKTAKNMFACLTSSVCVWRFWIILMCLGLICKSENFQTPIKNEASDTNARKNHDFRVEAIQNEVGEIDFVV